MRKILWAILIVDLILATKNPISKWIYLNCMPVCTCRDWPDEKCRFH